MLSKEIVHEMFSKCWKLFNAVRKNFTDEGWGNFVDSILEVHKMYDNEFSKRICLAVANEAERLSKMKGDDASKEYQAANKIFMGGFKLFTTCSDNSEMFGELGMKWLSSYLKEFDNHKFASELGTAVYDYFCSSVEDGPELFMRDAYGFYEEFQGGIMSENEKDAFVKAEAVIRAHPEYTLHIMKMFEGLKTAKTAKAA